MNNRTIITGSRIIYQERAYQFKDGKCFIHFGTPYGKPTEIANYAFLYPKDKNRDYPVYIIYENKEYPLYKGRLNDELFLVRDITKDMGIMLRHETNGFRFTSASYPVSDDFEPAYPENNIDEIPIHFQEKAYRVDGDICYIYIEETYEDRLESNKQIFLYDKSHYPNKQLALVVDGEIYLAYKDTWERTPLKTDDFSIPNLKNVTMHFGKTLESRKNVWNNPQRNKSIPYGFVPKYPEAKIEDDNTGFNIRIQTKDGLKEVKEIRIMTKHGLRNVVKVLVQTPEGLKEI